MKTMKRIVLFALLMLCGGAVVAQSVDSLTLLTAPRKELRLPQGAEGYTVTGISLFNSVQTISVIRYSPKRFRTSIVLPEKLTQLSQISIPSGADFSVNAGYWDVSNAQPSTFLKINGRQIATTADFEKERVDGVVCIAKRKVVIDGCKADSESRYAKQYRDILASGPMLIDEGKSVDHTAYINTMVEAVHGKDIGAHYTYIRRHPRTAMGTDSRGNVLLLVVDGRSVGNAEGVTIVELTKICEWLGMSNAINLDGGSSSTMWSKEEGVVNFPCRNKKFDHEGERRVSSILAVRRR